MRWKGNARDELCLSEDRETAHAEKKRSRIIPDPKQVQGQTHSGHQLRGTSYFRGNPPAKNTQLLRSQTTPEQEKNKL